jgi:DNA-binding NarL/FixJ family response regulator
MSRQARRPGSRACRPRVIPESARRRFRGRPVVTRRWRCNDLHMTASVLIVDDHESFRRSARMLLELEGFEVVGEAEDGASALELARLLQPELVLLDIALPDTNGYDVAQQLAGGPSKVILTSSREQRDLGRRVRTSGALGFVAKDRLSGQALTDLLEEDRR